MDFSRYMAQMRLPEVGKEGQRLLAESRVLIVGCGALGSPVAMYLAGAGTGHLTVADFDTVEISNLHRQLFYREEDAGKPKADLLAARIRDLNSGTDVEVINKLVTPALLEERGREFDAIVDAADNPDTTYMTDDFCAMTGIPYCTAGVRGWEAQIFTYCGKGTTYREIVPPSGEREGLLPCSIAGITGPTAGLAAAIQVAEILKILVGTELTPSLITVDLLSGAFNRLYL